MTATTTTSTPGWLLRTEPGLCACGCVGKRRKGSFLTKTIEGGSRLLRQVLFADDVSSRDGLLQRVEPRVKVLTVMALLITTSFVHHIPTLLAMYGSTLVLAALSRLPLRVFVQRVWLFVPIFTGLVVLPATFSLITPGDEVISFGTWFGHDVAMTSQGLTAAGLIVLRVATSISLVVLLTLTTSWTRLLAALRALLVPKMFVLVLGMAYRYLFHLLDSVTDMYTARKARTVLVDADAGRGRAFVASSAGALFGKAHALSDEVHLAMVSRGYTGNPRMLRAAKIRAYDIAVATALVLTALMLLGFDRGL